MSTPCCPRSISECVRCSADSGSGPIWRSRHVPLASINRAPTDCQLAHPRHPHKGNPAATICQFCRKTPAKSGESALSHLIQKWSHITTSVIFSAAAELTCRSRFSARDAISVLNFIKFAYSFSARPYWTSESIQTLK